jgi:hypothetical protein
MQREELYVADLVDNTRAVREYLDGRPYFCAAATKYSS